MSSDERARPKSWLIDLLDPYAAEIRARSLVIQVELDSHFQIEREPLLALALERLLRFVFLTLPSGCELYIASARTTASVASLGSGALTLRWQVAGQVRGSAPGGITAIRPITGGAAFHAQSDAAAELEELFSSAGWTLELDAARGDRELWVRASTR